MNTKPARRALPLAAMLLLAGSALWTGQASADEGMVIWKNRYCGYFILQLKSGYGLFEWISGPLPNDGDVIEGDIKAPGEYRIENKTADLPSVVYLEELSAHRAAIAARIPEKCKARDGYVPFESQ